MNFESRRRVAGALVLFATFAVATTAAGEPGGIVAGSGVITKRPASARESQVDRARAYWKTLNLIGFRGVGLLAKDGKTVLLEGSGGVTPTATFNLASIAKSITAIAVLRLAHRGKLGLDDTLDHFFPDAPADKRAITVHQLLTHTGGLGNPTGDTAEGVKDRGQAVRMILATALVDKPGHSHHYSNDGYTLLAAILEVAASKSWEQVIHDEILRPAGMRRTFFLGDSLPGGPYAIARAVVTDGERVENDANWGSKGGAGIYSNAEDLLRFMNAAVDGTLLGSQGVRELGKSYAPEGQLEYSRVFSLANIAGRGPQWGHGGADTGSGHYSDLVYYPNTRLLVVILGLDDEDLKTQVSSGLSKVLFREGAGEVPPSRPGHPAIFRERLELRGGSLLFTIDPGAGPALLLPQNSDATSFLVARSEAEKATLEGCVTETGKLLEQVAQLAAADGELPDSQLGRAAAAWRQANLENGPVKNTTILGATPNWVDGLGGTLSFVRVAREKQTSVFRLYWSGSTLRARGGQVYKNPAPLRLIDFGGDDYGGWNPAIGVYVDLRLSLKDGKRQAILEAGGKSIALTMTSQP
jgi:CubicO group peptidase (beta-lactamase class C family)